MSGATTAVELRPVASLQPHPRACELPRLTDNEYLTLRDDIACRGVQVPLEVTADGTVLAGHARLRAAFSKTR